VSEQCIYNLAERNVELEVLPACEDYGLGVIPWSPLWRGMLAGVLDGGGDKGVRRSSSMVQDKLGEHRPQVEAYEKFCAELGQPPAEVALAWLLANPVVTSPIIGPRIPEQLESAMRALDLRLDKATMKRLDEIWPGPGGPAPEAFAW
jgi:aryl-alcohol dehydrogenase-like predicted oxidoreductase